MRNALIQSISDFPLDIDSAVSDCEVNAHFLATAQGAIAPLSYCDSPAAMSQPQSFHPTFRGCPRLPGHPIHHPRIHPYQRRGMRGGGGHGPGCLHTSRNFAFREMGFPALRFPPPPMVLMQELQNQYRNLLLDYGYPERLQPRYFPEGDFLLPPSASMLTDMGLPLPDFSTDSDSDGSSTCGDTASDLDITTSATGSDGRRTTNKVTGAARISSDGNPAVRMSPCDESQGSHFDIEDCEADGSVMSSQSCASCGRPLTDKPYSTTLDTDHGLFQRLGRLARGQDFVCQCAAEKLSNATGQRSTVTSEIGLHSEFDPSPENASLNPQRLSHASSADDIPAVLPVSEPLLSRESEESTEYRLTNMNNPDNEQCTTDCEADKRLQIQFSSDVRTMTVRMRQCEL